MEQRKATNKKIFKWTGIIIGGMIVIALIGKITGAGEAKQDATTTESTSEATATTTATESTEPSTSESAETGKKPLGPSLSEAIEALGLKRSDFKKIDGGWQYAQGLIAFTIKGSESAPHHANLVMQMRSDVAEAMGKVLVSWVAAFTDNSSASAFATRFSKKIDSGERSDTYTTSTGHEIVWFISDKGMVIVTLEKA